MGDLLQQQNLLILQLVELDEEEEEEDAFFLAMLLNAHPNRRVSITGFSETVIPRMPDIGRYGKRPCYRPGTQL
jgi:hypothetical protein